MSSSILQKLNSDHKDIARILYCLRAQIKDFENPDIEHSLTQIINILDYISTVPERWHHPVEDLVFNRLLEKNPPHPEQLRAVLQEHEYLERLTQELRNAFEQVSIDISVPLSRLYRTADIYLSRQMLHMDAEEAVLFPMAEEYLVESDWLDIERGAAKVLESFDDRARKAYKELCEEILDFEVEA